LRSTIEINRPEVVEEVRALCGGYDKALLANDVPALEAYFWNHADAVRFGATEELYGAEEISAFRRARVVNFGDRHTLRETIVTFGDDLAIATVEFAMTIAGVPRHGRQSQVWVRFGEPGWRIVSAHVSHRVTSANGAAFGPAPAYASAAAALVGLPVDPAYAAGVATNIDLMARIVAPLMALDLDGVEPAPRFIP
jgi:ketosteroid isomerase-like protein